jgi:hypothetical protein
MQARDILEDRGRAEAVWRRVTGEAPPQEPADGAGGENAALLHFMEREAADARFYSALAARAGGGAGRLLSSMAAGSRRRLRDCGRPITLKRARSFSPGPACAVRVGVRDALRLRYAEENARRAEYLAAAASAPEGLSELYLRYAEECAWRVSSIRRLCRRLMAQRG